MPNSRQWRAVNMGQLLTEQLAEIVAKGNITAGNTGRRHENVKQQRAFVTAH